MDYYEEPEIFKIILVQSVDFFELKTLYFLIFLSHHDYRNFCGKNAPIKAASLLKKQTE